MINMKNKTWTKRLAVGALTFSLLAGVVYTGHEVQQSQPKIEDSVGAAKGTKFSKTQYQTTEQLNVRSGASTKNKVVTKLPKGTKIYSDYRIGSWYKVSYKGKTGYVSGAYLKKVTSVSTSKEPAKSKDTKMTKATYQTTETLNVRSGASTKYKVVTKIPKGTKVTSDAKQGSWYKVTYKGKTGYVSSAYLKKVTATKPTPSKPTPSKPSTPSDTKWMSKASAENILKKEYSKVSSYSYLYYDNGRAVTEVQFLGTSNAKAELTVFPFLYLGALTPDITEIGEENYKEWKAVLKVYNKKIKTYAMTQIDAKYADTFVKEVEKFALTSKRKQTVVKKIGGKNFVFSNTGDFVVVPK